MVTIARRRQAEQFLQKPVDRGRGEKIAAAHDVGDALQRIVDGDRQMVARREVAPAQDDVAPGRRLGAALVGSDAFAEFRSRRSGPAPAPIARRMSSRNAARSPRARRAARFAGAGARQVPQ